ncbi:glutaredoxin-C9-like [Pyrus x bretschneideri]|uniref:glutaredoxin-C9-like n=1 Tax=Pyrus x bretschneideri TaxID=225117 RepID=UPI00202DB8D9|nr:glutaredoxin-C9-like [Pyrus x bretschneideri]
MQSETIPQGTWIPGTRPGHAALSSRDVPSEQHVAAASVQKLVSENAVTVVGRRGCCMCHVVKRLLLGHGVNPTVFEVDEDDETGVVIELRKLTGEGQEDWQQFPVVFVGGKLFGGLERVMATHITGELVPVLKQAGALWL